MVVVDIANKPLPTPQYNPSQPPLIRGGETESPPDKPACGRQGGFRGLYPNPPQPPLDKPACGRQGGKRGLYPNPSRPPLIRGGEKIQN